MVLSEVFDLFVKQSPVTVMVRATMENVLSAQGLDNLFAETAVRQRPSELAFSLVADLMGTVVCGVRPSMHAAFQARSDEIDVTIKALYDKLRRIEPLVTRELVRGTAARLAAIIDHTEGSFRPWLPGYRVKILDGNHLRRTDRRLKELRTQNSAPLPGHSLVMLDPERMLAIDMFPCTDGHAQERSLLPAVLPTIERGDVIVADRNFCTMDFFAGIADREAGFLVRQHKKTLRWELGGDCFEVGRIDTGIVYEQSLCLLPKEEEPWLVRRITVELDEPTRDGDTELHVLTNLPESISACQIAESAPALSEQEKPWLELHNPWGVPAYQEAGNRTLLIREGWTGSHNNTEKISDWISHLVSAEHIGEGPDRTDDFREDPKLQPEYRAFDSDYGNQGGTIHRGHQCPAEASTGRGMELMSESFFMSNMTPQNGSLNSGKWRALEDRIGKWCASREALWVITGPAYVDDDGDGEVEFHVIGNGVYMPSHYFKIIVDKDGDEFDAIAFLIENEKPISGDVDNWLTQRIKSIDEIEEITGLDFIPGMSQRVEEDLEARKPTELWQ